MTDNNNERFIEKNVDSLVTVTTFKCNTPMEVLLRMLEERGTTGDLCFHFNEGGIRRIELTEKTRATDARSDRIRKIFKME